MLTIGKLANKRPGLLRRLLAERKGATAIEFAILAPMFFAIAFATIETFVSYMAEQVLLNANDEIARQIRLGNITFNTGRNTDHDRKKFREKFCAELTVLVTCSLLEPGAPKKMFIDVYKADTFADLPKDNVVPATLIEGRYTPGGKGTLNVIRVYYRWPVLMDYLRLLPPNYSSLGSDRILMATAVIQNEEF